MRFSFGVWCVFDLFCCIFVGHCSVCLLFGCVVYSLSFCIAYWSLSMGTFDVIVFDVFIWCLVSFEACFVALFFWSLSCLFIVWMYCFGSSSFSYSNITTKDNNANILQGVPNQLHLVLSCNPPPPESLLILWEFCSREW